MNINNNMKLQRLIPGGPEALLLYQAHSRHSLISHRSEGKRGAMHERAGWFTTEQAEHSCSIGERARFIACLAKACMWGGQHCMCILGRLACKHRGVIWSTHAIIIKYIWGGGLAVPTAPSRIAPGRAPRRAEGGWWLPVWAARRQHRWQAVSYWFPPAPAVAAASDPLGCCPAACPGVALLGMRPIAALRLRAPSAWVAVPAAAIYVYIIKYIFLSIFTNDIFLIYYYFKWMYK
jgi:hypothetical protein